MPPPRTVTLTLVELYELGAARRSMVVSTKDLGKRLGLSQQAVSKHLTVLEKDGYVQRTRAGRGNAVLILPEGKEVVLGVYSRLKQAVEGSPTEIVFHGRVFKGLGEGAYYTSLEGYSRQFKRILGFVPYPGTLNLELDPSEVPSRRELGESAGLQVKGFTDSKRSYGPVKCFRAELEGGLEAAVLDIERTHHGSGVLELIAPYSIRTRLSLSEGDRVTVSVRLD